LACFENHLVVNWKQFVYEQPSAVRAQLLAVTVLKQPCIFSRVEINLALQTRQLAVFKPDIAGGHAADQDFLRAVEIKLLVCLGPVNEPQLDSVLAFLFISLNLALILKKINGHVRVTIRYNVSVF